MGIKDRDYYYENRNADGSFRESASKTTSRPGPCSSDQGPSNLQQIYWRLRWHIRFAREDINRWFQRSSFLTRLLVAIFVLFLVLTVYRLAK